MNTAERISRWCVFLPCSEEETWAVPQNCLGEIITLHDVAEEPPEDINWRGHEVPVLDLDKDGSTPWRESHGGTGRVAIFLGLDGQPSSYWGLALRGEGLAMDTLLDDQLEALPEEEIVPHALGGFRARDKVYQIPDLVEIPGLMLRREEIVVVS